MTASNYLLSPSWIISVTQEDEQLDKCGDQEGNSQGSGGREHNKGPKDLLLHTVPV